MSGPDTASSPDTRRADADPDGPTPRVSALHTSPDRVILTEAGNADGWLASDTAVELTDRT